MSPMRVALCISGELNLGSNVIAAAAQHILPDETVDVFASLWTPPDVGEERLREWFGSQFNSRMTLRRWTYEPVRVVGNWVKAFKPDTYKQAQTYVEQLERLEYNLQVVSQLKDEQERLNGVDYDAVVRMECSYFLKQAPRLAKFRDILKDHIVLGQQELSWYPSYDFRVAMMSSRNMDAYSAIQTVHRRQYVSRYTAVKLEDAFVAHMHHARLKTLCVPVVYTNC